MMQRVLSHFQFPLLTCLGLFLFMGVFLAALGWVFRKGSGEFYQILEGLPLQDLQPEIPLYETCTKESK